MKPIVKLYKLGRLPYVKALNIQQVLFDKLKKDVASCLSSYDRQRHVSDSSSAQLTSLGESLQLNRNGHETTTTTANSQRLTDYCLQRAGNSLILVEHDPVYTIGIRSKQYNDNYVSKLKKKLIENELDADFVQTNRGGLITFHGPGQLVAYPIIYLGDFRKTIHNRSVKAYVKLLESTIIDTLSNVGLEGAHTVREHPGVWLDGGDRKIAFVGISCSRYVTMHGISINCNCDLSWFDHIVSCGIEGKEVTSILEELLPANNQLLSKQQQQRRQHQLAAAQYSDPHDSTTNNNLKPLPIIHNHVASQLSKIETADCNMARNSDCKPRYDVEYVSEAFCQSFSQHFHCNLLEDTVDS